MTVQSSVATDGLGDALASLDTHDIVQRIWQRDATVWTDPIAPEVENRLGWLDAPEVSLALVPIVHELAEEALAAGVTDVVLCGMGGSSLAPEVFAASLPRSDRHPKLTVIDSTHPDAVAAVDRSTPAASTWYVISSKSGGTLETLSLFRYFWNRTAAVSSTPGTQFIAVTDPDSGLADLAAERQFRSVVLADPDVGGRYSALTAFGLVPAALIGADIPRLLDSGAIAAEQCRDPRASVNPGAQAGVAMAAGGPRPRIAYFDASAPALALPVWAEQLIAESTGKRGTGILPVAGGPKPLGTEATVVSLGAAPDGEADVALRFDDPYDIAGAMFILEFATAVAGHVLGIHPFDQPDVQLAKELAHAAMSGDLDARPAEVLAIDDAADGVAAMLNDPAYVSVQAYVPMDPATEAALATLADAIATRTGAFVTVGFGPRFLHSTGQLHKGGFAGGSFLQILQTAETDISIPESEFSFGELIRGQALGDRAALEERGRDVVSVRVGGDAAADIVRLASMIG